MKTKLTLKLSAALLLLVTINYQLSTLLAQGTSFTYQGRLNDGTNQANGKYDFEFRVYDSATVGTGASQGSPAPNPFTALPVSNGLFTVVLDFGTGVFTNTDRYLEIRARTNAAPSFGTLSPRQKLTPTPYAIYAGNAAQIGGQVAGAFVAKAGDTMTGTLNLPANGLALSGGQLFVSGGNVFVGNALNVDYWGNNNGAVNPGLTFGFASGEGISSKRTGGGNQFGLDLYTASTPRLSITGGGNVGIGTASPSARMEIADSGQTLLQLSGANSAGTWLSLANSSAGGRSWSLIGTGPGNGEGAGKLLVWDGSAGATRITVDTAGNVGIGTTTPAAQLHVSGSGGDSTPQAWLDQQNGGDYSRLRFTVGGSYPNRWDVGTTPSIFTIYSGYYGRDYLHMDANGVHTPAGLVIENRTSDPTNAVPGQIWLRTDLP